MSRTIVKELYQSLTKTSREKSGKLFINGFDEDMYEELFYEILDPLKQMGYVDEDFEYWYRKNSIRYYKEKRRLMVNPDFYCPQIEKEVFSQTYQEMLVVLKFFLKRRTYSAFDKKCDDY